MTVVTATNPALSRGSMENRAANAIADVLSKSQIQELWGNIPANMKEGITASWARKMEEIDGSYSAIQDAVAEILVSIGKTPSLKKAWQFVEESDKQQIASRMVKAAETVYA